jgi:chaperonin GroES
MNITPLQDWAVIRPSGADEITAGGIIIPDTAKEKPHEGVVEAIGPGALEEEKYGKKKIEKKDRRFIATTVKPGDTVLYEQYAGQTYTIGGEELVMVRERNILGILPERQPRQAPLLIPARTTASGSTALMPSTAPVAQKRAAPKKKSVKKAAKKAAKKSIKKSAKRKTTTPKKKAAKKAVKKAVKKPAKSAAKPARKRKASARKSAKKK